MSGLLRRILPREKSFFQMFNQQAENVEAGAIAMVEMLEHFEDAAARADKVEDFEHLGDTITHNILRKLNQTFVTPFDREDIHELASKIDDVIDLVDAAATRMVTYRVKALRPGVLDLATTVRSGYDADRGGGSAAGQGRPHPGPLYRDQPAGKSGGPAVPGFDRHTVRSGKRSRRSHQVERNYRNARICHGQMRGRRQRH